MKRSRSPQDQNAPGKKKAIDDDDNGPNVLNNSLFLPESVLFQKVGGFLHWKDCMNLGELNKEYRQSFLPFREVILRPLLDQLENLCKSNVHSYCGKTYAPASKRICTCGSDVDVDQHDLPDRQELAALDPRYENDAYDSLPIDAKCARMVGFLTTIVANMRPHLNLSSDTVANPVRMPEAIGTIEGNWSLGMGHQGNAVLQMYPRRTALAFNIALVDFAQSAMESGDNIYFNQAFLGNGGIDPSGSGFGDSMCYIVEQMLPLNNTNIINYIRKQVLPSEGTLALLGFSLSSRVILSAPFLEWMDEDDNLVLPEGLEHFDGATVHRAMAQWDDRDDGRGWLM